MTSSILGASRCSPAFRRHAIELALRFISPEPCRSWRFYSSAHVDQTLAKEGDVVLLSSGPPKPYNHLSKPLKHGRAIENHFGKLNESDLIGKPFRSLVQVASKRDSKSLHLLRPTLEEYTSLTPRVVTPVSDASYT